MSRFDVLAKRNTSPPEVVGAGKTTVSRRGNPDFRQFSAYIPLDLYRRLKVRLAEQDLDLSQAVEQALDEWVRSGGKLTSK